MALAPEHWTDLRKSGLSDDVITLLRIEAVRPHEIRIKGVSSAYSLPYFNLDGSVNGFARRKLFPPVMTPDGHTQKYCQERGSRPHLYLPPLVDWRTVAKNPKTELIVTEGEKKAACACQRGLVTAGIGGVWNWTSTLDNGDRLVLPMLDEFDWLNRPVQICPDSDAWHDNGKGIQILRGFFALAKDLQQRKAVVKFVVLPDLHGVKCGLDDWLVVPAHDVEHSWLKLERRPLDAARFNALTAWWQKWREKQATQEALKAQDQDELTLEEVAGLYTVRVPKHQVVLTFDRLQDQRGIHAEVTVSMGATVLLDAVDLGLKSDSGQTKLVQSLKTYAASIPWKIILQKSCGLVLKRYRRGEPPSHLNKDTPVEPLTFAINPLVPRRKPVILFADGGKGKSTFALMLAMLTATGQSLAGFSALKGIPLYLDWEDDRDVHARRVQAIQQGHPDLLLADVLYQRCTEPLTKLTHDLARTVQAAGITFVVVDSLVAAAGGDTSVDATGKLFAAIRALNVESLIIGHVPKTIGEGQEYATVYGSIFNQNYARGLWELKTEQEIGEDSAILGLFHRKHNLTRKHPPIGLKVTHNQDGTLVKYESFDLSQTAELVNALPLPNRIRNLLESDGVPRSSKEIADELDAKPGSVKTTLSNPRYKGVKWSMLGEGKAAQWTVLSR